MKPRSNISFVQYAIMLSMLIVALSVAYYLVFFIPNKANRVLQVYKDCDAESLTKAKELLKSKISVAESSGQGYTNQVQIWKAASDKDLYLKDDYNAIYENCLRRNGIKY